jgi:hypothetical protein
MTLHRAGRWLPVLALAMAVAALALSAGSVPHVHVGPGVGLWNLEHDLSLLATRGVGAPLPEAAPVIGVALVVATVLLPACLPFVSAPRRHSAPRAPPLR